MEAIHTPDPNKGARALMPHRKRKHSLSLEFRGQHSDENNLVRKRSNGSINRIRGIGFLGHTNRNHFVACTGEFTGTFLFLFFAFSGTQVANTTNQAETETQSSTINRVLFISLCFGFSLAVNAWVFFRISGGLFNPAVTVGMCLVGALPVVRSCLLFISQILGGIASAAVVSALFPGPLVVTTELQVDTSKVQGLFIEMFLTAQLVFTIFMLAAEKHKATFIAPVGIGLSLFVAELTGVFFTGGSLNPARTFGPAVVLHNFVGYHWIYWIGPILGAVVASGFYFLMKKLEYETANPDQDAEEIPDAGDLEKGGSDDDLPRSDSIMSMPRTRDGEELPTSVKKHAHFASDADTIVGSTGIHSDHSIPLNDNYSYGYWVPVKRPDEANAPPGAVLYMRQLDDMSHISRNTTSTAPPNVG